MGAPFEGSGKVYIWMGSMKGVSSEPSQVTYYILHTTYLYYILYMYIYYAYTTTCTILYIYYIKKY